MQYFSKTDINFVGVRRTFAMISMILVILGLVATFILKPVLGIDFKGGAEIALNISGNPSIGDVRDIIANAGIKGAEIKSFGDANSFLIRIMDVEEGPDMINEALKSGFASETITMLKVDKIGPKIGAELFTEAIWAIIIAVIAILVYVAFRFEFNFGVGAIIALVHDVVLTFSTIVVVHHLGLVDLELNQAILAGMLTVVGYSINDTVIIFDRIRENIEKHKGMNYIKMINMSLNETLSRTINTTTTTIMVLLVLFIFGGPVLQGFAFTMFFGIVYGTYSSIYISSNYVIWRHENTDKQTSDSKSKKIATAKA
ncbi:MAG: protein translocase subunit SecF [Candidatus Kapabacteria bacterium]|nr:protein translocase subunit SecF [Ignavibacteriota bacterium]MCW5885471.1 protein translocase subunit SecF [Candidatus Kapabacteria bacterium]